MYHLYLDESGDDGDYLDSNGIIIPGSSRYLVVGGILIEDVKIKDFDQRLNDLLDKYFTRNGISLPNNFKLHCTDLKKGIKPPYNQLTKTEIQELTDDVFNVVITLDCSLIVASLDIQKHCNKYNDRINPKAYMLFICYEKLEQIRNNANISAEVIYEEFNQIRKKINDEIQKLLSFNFPNPQNLRDIEKHVKSGKQNQHSGLQFADFIANATWFHRTQPNQINDRFKAFHQKFFSTFNGSHNYGYIEI